MTEEEMRKAALDALMERIKNQEASKLSGEAEVMPDREALFPPKQMAEVNPNELPPDEGMEWKDESEIDWSKVPGPDDDNFDFSELQKPINKSSDQIPADMSQPKTPGMKAAQNAQALQPPSVGMPEGGAPALGQEDNLMDKMKQKNKQAYIDELMRQAR